MIDKAPGPPGTLGMRNLVRFAADPLQFLRTMTTRYGDVADMPILGKHWFLLNHPDAIEEVLVKRASVMERDEYIEILQYILGQGLLTSEGALWKRQRKLMAQAFTPKRIRTYATTMATVAHEGVNWPERAVINIHDEMSRVTMEIVAKVLFGTGMAPEEVELVRTSMETIAEYTANSPEALAKLPLWAPTPRLWGLRRAIHNIDKLMYRIINQRRSSSESDGNDLLGTLLAACDDDGTGMTDQQLRDETITLFLAGHETTAIALAHTLTLVSKHPQVERKLVAELDAVLNGRLPLATDVQQLPYTEQVIKEGMRLYPPAWITGREVREDIHIGGVFISKGSQVIMSPWVVHRDPRFFPNPEAFDPDRWATDRKLPRYAYFPFGGGPRVCIGNHFAMMEAILVMAVVMQRYHLELLPGERLELVPSVTLRAKQGMRMRVFPRQPTTHPTKAPNPQPRQAATCPAATARQPPAFPFPFPPDHPP
ncbi:MAG: cytochrome P450, partial [Myxococcota bacterium]